MRLVTAVFGCLLLIAGCGRDKEQCQAMTLALTDLREAYQDLKGAAEVGNSELFGKANAALDQSLKKVSAVEVTGKSLQAESTEAYKREALEFIPKVLPAHEALLAAVKANPSLGAKHQGGRAVIGDAGPVAPEMQANLDRVTGMLNVGSAMKCQ